MMLPVRWIRRERAHLRPTIGVFSVRAHPPDQRAEFRIDLGAASQRVRFPPPVPTGSRPDANARGSRAE